MQHNNQHFSSVSRINGGRNAVVELRLGVVRQGILEKVWCGPPNHRASRGKEIDMAKFLVEVNYTLDGLKGLIKEGGSGRVEAINKVIQSVGGKLESVYFAFGHVDAYITVDAPDNFTAAGLSLMVSAAGAAKTNVIVLLTAEEIDAAVKLHPSYRLPGQ